MTTKILENTDVVKYAAENENVSMMHVCNNKFVMGSGVAKQVKSKFPSAFSNYRGRKFGLGDVSYSNCSSVINLVAQDGYFGYNKDYTKRRFLNYGALALCLSEVDIFNLQNLGVDTIAIPYKMGADRC